MRTPNRKPGKYVDVKFDPHITAEKYNELKTELEKLKKIVRPQLASEVKRLAELGDFSENTEYQIAKGKLRGLNRRILEVEKLINHSKIIEPNKNTDRVQLGHLVTFEIDGKQKTYQILGSAETDPTRGVISRNSPLGSALMGRRVGDVVSVEIAGKTVECRVAGIR